MTQQEIKLDEIIPIIDFHLKRPINQRAFPKSEYEDTLHDLIVTIYEYRDEFNPAIASWPTFVNMVTKRELKRKRFLKRWQRHCAVRSFEEIGPSDEPLTNYCPTYELNEVELQVFLGEMREVIRTLPNELQAVCRSLVVHTKRGSATMFNMEPPDMTREIKKIESHFRRSKILQGFF